MSSSWMPLDDFTCQIAIAILFSYNKSLTFVCSASGRVNLPSFRSGQFFDLLGGHILQCIWIIKKIIYCRHSTSTLTTCVLSELIAVCEQCITVTWLLVAFYIQWQGFFSYARFEQAAGYLRPGMPVEIAAECLVGIVMRLAESQLYPSKQGPAALAEQAADIVLHGMLAESLSKESRTGEGEV